MGDHRDEQPPGADDEGYEAHRQPQAPPRPQTPREQPQGIEGLQGREPIAAALSVGVKGPSGAPVEKDRFHVLRSHAQTAQVRGRSTLIREPHPSFGSFNAADAGRRRPAAPRALGRVDASRRARVPEAQVR